KESGYDNIRFIFEAESAKYHIELNTQSPDIAVGVNETSIKEQGAGDQGIMFGYAKNDTESLLPLPIHLAHELTKQLAIVREQGIVQGLGPDGKSQVSVIYDEKHQPVAISAIVVST